MIREASARDVAELATLYEEMQLQHADMYPTMFHRTALPDLEKDMKQLLDDPMMSVLVAEEADAIIGYAVARRTNREDTIIVRGHRLLVLDQIKVRGTHRRRGIGRKLVESVRDLARKQDV